MDLLGDRVRLRAFRDDDAEAITRLVALPEVAGTLELWARSPYRLAEAQDFLARRSADSPHWAVECVADGAFLGVTGLEPIDWRNRHAEWGIWLGPASRWGRGYGGQACRLAVSYAFWELGLEKVCLQVLPDNERARRAYARSGFTEEGRLRRHIFRQGRFDDLIVMAVHRDHPIYQGAPLYLPDLAPGDPEPAASSGRTGPR